MTELNLTIGDASTIYDLLQTCPRCRAFPKLQLAYGSAGTMSINCNTVGCPIAVDQDQCKWHYHLDDAIAAWNSLVYRIWVRPAVIAALIQAGVYHVRQR